MALICSCKGVSSSRFENACRNKIEGVGAENVRRVCGGALAQLMKEDGKLEQNDARNLSCAQRCRCADMFKKIAERICSEAAQGSLETNNPDSENAQKLIPRQG